MFEKRKHTMFARWDRMAKAFTRCGREISIAVKSGGDNPDYNPSLRRAIQNARAVNMPKDNIAKAIKKASGADAVDYETVYYEGYGPHGIAIMVETATDNQNRTVANVRLIFRKNGGNVGTTGSVAYMFVRQGVFTLQAQDRDEEELELDLMDFGLEELEHDQNSDNEPVLVVRTAFTDFNTMSNGLESLDINPISSITEFTPTATTELSEDQMVEVLALIDKLEQDDDVQRVFHTLA
jgi:YebC/PmpR family DNA-binding regulatory protein